ncbi:MAG: cupin domain-containing protein [Acidobacteriota bacterium]
MMLNKILTSYDWFDHPDGPKFVETHRDTYRTVGHWLFLPQSFSAFHRVENNEEIWAIHSGRLLIHILEPPGQHKIFRLGMDFNNGERPVVTVAKGVWQAAEIPAGVEFAFGTNICAPPFSFAEFSIAKRETLVQQFPQHEESILRLTRS